MIHLTETTDLLLSTILALGAFGAGLSALNLNLTSIIKLNQFNVLFKYVCGVVGLFGAYIIITQYANIQESSAIGLPVCIILVVTNIGIGISGIGTNILRVLHMESLQKSLQLIAGAAGIYTLIVLIQAQQ